MIKILLEIVPRFGEILLGVGETFLNVCREAWDEEEELRNDLKKYLLEKAVKKKCMTNVGKCSEFQDVLYKHTGNMVRVTVVKRQDIKDATVNVYLIDFFHKAIWPVIVDKYMNSINLDTTEPIRLFVRIKKQAYVSIYKKDDYEAFFSEFKTFLLYNYIVISYADIDSNGDMTVELMIPEPQSRQLD